MVLNPVAFVISSEHTGSKLLGFHFLVLVISEMVSEKRHIIEDKRNFFCIFSHQKESGKRQVFYWCSPGYFHIGYEF
jgi:hypothetical protein